MKNEPVPAVAVLLVLAWESDAMTANVRKGASCGQQNTEFARFRPAELQDLLAAKYS